ncbi:MAG: hypothetical protein IIU63_01950 [Clostridia bacterium]|nr:hypothetical protein [Clostridia bacterium]
MNRMDMICIFIAELVPLTATLFCLVYGLKHFFKKGKPLNLQSVTMAMGSHALGSIYHLCQTMASEEQTYVEGFTPAYLGRIGFFLFMLTASYAQLDKIVDDSSAQMRPAKRIALIAPICAILLFIPNAILDDVAISTKIVYGMVWVPASFSVYYNLKHAIIPDLDFGFIKAIKPYNFLALMLGFSELLCLTAWLYGYPVPMAITAILFAILCISTMVSAKRGVEKWTV